MGISDKGVHTNKVKARVATCKPQLLINCSQSVAIKPLVMRINLPYRSNTKALGGLVD